MVLITLDTTRADALGASGRVSFAGGPARTPTLDAIAADGVRFANALTPVPLTLPAHATLLTGLEPRRHGLRDNGAGHLPSGLPTLAEAMRAAGYRTGAFVAARVLDRRFGLDRGFDRYDDRLSADQVGESGEPERDAAAVTGAVLAWAHGLPSDAAYFLWVHYYDPHSPYAPPRDLAAGGGLGQRYAGEVAFVDREIGRLLDGLPDRRAERLVAAVGDHGEALGEHGEPAHGVLLHSATLHVPLLIQGPGVPRGRVLSQPVSTSRLASTLLHLAGVDGAETISGPPLRLDAENPIEAMVAETLFPTSAYGWKALRAVTLWPWRLVVGGRSELFHLEEDAGETSDRLGSERRTARRLEAALEAGEKTGERGEAVSVEADAELEAALRSLGYTAAPALTVAGNVDPRDGVYWLADLETAKSELAAGDCGAASRRLEGLVVRSPANRTFLFNLSAAQLACRQGEGAIRTLRSALALDPRSPSLHASLAEAHLVLGQDAAGRGELEVAVRLDPAMTRAWLRLAELAGAGKRDVLRRAAPIAESARVWVELGALEAAGGDLAAAAAAYAEASRIEPRWGLAWRLQGEVAEAQREWQAARQHYVRAASADPLDAATYLRLGALVLRAGELALARSYLERCAALAPATVEAAAARRLLDTIPR